MTFEFLSRRTILAGCSTASLALIAACSPVTLVQRAVEDRSAEDIAEDNRIVLGVNKLMAKYKTVSVSTEIYEQRLLVYGVVEDKSVYDGLQAEIGNISGIRKLYWHVRHMTEAQQEAEGDRMIGFAEGLKVKAEIEAAWLNAEGVESLNFRVAVDPMGAAYVLGRAKTAGERSRALGVVKNTERVRSVTDYVTVR